MITQQSVNYAKVLLSLGLKDDMIRATRQILTEIGELVNVLENPSVKKREKEMIIDEVFDKEIGSFIKVLCENQVIGNFSEVFEAYDELIFDQRNIVKARLSYAVKPEASELEQIKAMICEKYKKTGIELELNEDKSLIGGFILMIGDMEYDKSIRGALAELQKTLIRR